MLPGAAAWPCVQYGLCTYIVRVRLQIIRNARISNVGKSQSCMVSKLRIILPGDATNRSALDPAVFAEQLEEMLLLVLPTEKDGLEEHPDQEGSDEEDPREAEIRVRFHIIGHARISM